MAIASAVAWIFAAVVHIFLFLDHNLFVSIQVLLEAAFLVLLIFCSVIVYREIRRHELQIAQGHPTDRFGKLSIRKVFIPV